MKTKPFASLADLNPEQITELAAYAKWAGADWKKKLLADWNQAHSRYPGEWAYLQQIRNAHGPTWLAACPQPVTGYVHDCAYNLVVPDLTVKWSGPVPIPTIGTPVRITFNNLGTGRICAYFVEHGWLGVAVALDHPPDWRTDQGVPVDMPACAFGIEIALLEGDITTLA
jgi:hypothetical protein